eukprot:g12166.t1
MVCGAPCAVLAALSAGHRAALRCARGTGHRSHTYSRQMADGARRTSHGAGRAGQSVMRPAAANRGHGAGTGRTQRGVSGDEEVEEEDEEQEEQAVGGAARGTKEEELATALQQGCREAGADVSAVAALLQQHQRAPGTPARVVLVKGLAEVMGRSAFDGQTPQLTALLATCSRLDVSAEHLDPGCLQGLLDWLRQHCSRAPARQLSCVFRFFALARLHVPSLAEAVALQLARITEPKAWALLCWAFATLGHVELLQRSLLQAVQYCSQLGPQDVANMLWAGSVAGLSHDPIFDCLWARATQISASCFSVQDLRQLHVARLCAFVDAGRSESSSSLQLKQELESGIHMALEKAEARDSIAQRQLSRTLQDMGWVHEQEMNLCRGCDLPEFLRWERGAFLAIDLASAYNKLGLEFYGPSHFLFDNTAQLTRQRTGSTLLKERLLSALGWNMVYIDFRDWTCKTTTSERAQFLENRLAQFRVIGKRRDLPPRWEAS